MNTVYQYMQSQKVIDAYRKNLYLLQPFNEYQHFVSRLHLLDKYKAQTAKEVYGVEVEELEDLLNMTPDQAFELAVKEDSNGYLDKLKEKDDPKIKKYLWIGRICDDFNILRRNNQVIDKDIKHKVYKLLDDDMINFMCEESKDEYLRENEGTLCVNGIGYLLYLWDQPKKKVIEAFIDLYRYYLDKVGYKGLSDRNFVYGLTHCVIDISDFYTKNVNDQMSLFQETYPIGELYVHTITVICENLKSYTFTGTTLSLSSVSSDMLAELLMTYKLLLDDFVSNRWYEYGYVIFRVYQELVNRIDPRLNYIRDHKEEDPAEDLRRNEHTNILFILYSRYQRPSKIYKNT